MVSRQRRSAPTIAEIGAVCRLTGRPTLLVAAALIAVSCVLTIGWGRGLQDSTAEITTVTLAMQLTLVMMPVASVITTVGSILLALGIVLMILARSCSAVVGAGKPSNDDSEAEPLVVG